VLQFSLQAGRRLRLRRSAVETPTISMDLGGWFTTVLAEAKVENHTWHCNRHTFASRLVMAGVGLRQVGELLGHGTPQLVWRYSHLAPDHQVAAVELLVTPGAQIGLVTKSATDHKMPETEGNGMASNIAK